MACLQLTQNNFLTLKLPKYFVKHKIIFYLKNFNDVNIKSKESFHLNSKNKFFFQILKNKITFASK